MDYVKTGNHASNSSRIDIKKVESDAEKRYGQVVKLF